MSSEDKEVQENLGLFEAALRARPTELLDIAPNRLVLALDGSDQDATGRALAAHLCERLGCETVSRSAPPEDADAATRASVILGDATDADLVILPVPFGEDLDTLRRESLSSTIDILLRESRQPVLAVRQPVEDAAATMRHPVVVIDWHPELQVKAASWGCFLAGSDGVVDMVAGVGPGTMDEMTALVAGQEDDITLLRSLIERAELRITGGIVAAIQKRAAEVGFDSSFEILHGERRGKSAAERAAERGGLVVCSYRSGEQSASLHRLHDVILESSSPVLAVPV